VRLAVTTNTKETVLQQMCWLDATTQESSLVPIGPIVRGVIAFPILGTWWDSTTQFASQSIHLHASYGISNIFQQRPSAILNLIFLFDHVTVIVVRICCCIPNFIKINSRVRLPDAHNCSVSSAPLLGNGRPLPWQPHYGGHVGNVMGCDQSRFVPIGPLLSELWYFQYFPTWRPSAILNFKNFNIWSRDCHCGPNVLLCTKIISSKLFHAFGL